MDTVILNTTILTSIKGAKNKFKIINNGAIGIEDKKITFIGKMEDLHPEDRNADLIINGDNHLTMPGLINAHMHSNLTLLKGCAQDLPEIEWMRLGITPFINHITLEDILLSTKLTILEGLRSGTTTFVEYGLAVSNLVEKVYLPFKTRVVATEMINEISFVSNQEPNQLYKFRKATGKSALKRANKIFDLFKEEELVTGMYGPQALDMISIDFLKEIKQQAVERDTKIHMHIAQGGRERLQIRGRYGNDSTVIQILKENNLLDSTLLAAHCHDTTEKERELMVQSGVNMVVCPSSIAAIDGIVPPVEHYISLGGKAGLGTDQAPGPGHHNMFTEMKMAGLLTKILNKNPASLPPWDTLYMGTMGGAEILGLNKEIGSLEIGKKADIITINLRHPNLTPIVIGKSSPFKNIIPNLIYSSTGSEIDEVIISGEPIMINGEFLNINEHEILGEANERAQEIVNKSAEDWKKTGSKMVEYSKKGFL
ncbi:MAG: amidohydrolase family protein [archaeon]|nr:amidohydrolase family protein [archaeon]